MKATPDTLQQTTALPSNNTDHDGRLAVRNPADYEQVVGTVPALSAVDVADVYDRARNAAPTWAAETAITRGRVLYRAAELLRDRADTIARTLTLEMGKTLGEALGEVAKAADFFEYYAGLGRAPIGELLAHEQPGIRAWTMHEPLGVVLAITPWNDPLLTPARKLAPALLSGNAVVLKPASYTPLVAQALAEILIEAGLPVDVMIVVTGSTGTIGGPLLDNEHVRAVSFTGSNDVGEHLRRVLAQRNIKLLTELGGKNAAVVSSDADLDNAAATIATAAFAQAGQRCTATSRVIAEQSIADKLTERLRAAAETLVVGAGLDSLTTMGPTVSPDQQRLVLGFVKRAVDVGAQLVTGGSAPSDGARRRGGFVDPTVLRVDDLETEIWQEEVFGPVITIHCAPDLAAAVEAVNGSRFGLAASIFTTSLSTAQAFADRADVGQVSVNLPTSGWDVHMPFGGFKASGSGNKEQGTEGLAFYTRTKTVVQRA